MALRLRSRLFLATLCCTLTLLVGAVISFFYLAHVEQAIADQRLKDRLRVEKVLNIQQWANDMANRVATDHLNPLTTADFHDFKKEMKLANSALLATCNRADEITVASTIQSQANALYQMSIVVIQANRGKNEIEIKTAQLRLARARIRMSRNTDLMAKSFLAHNASKKAQESDQRSQVRWHILGIMILAFCLAALQAGILTRTYTNNLLGLRKAIEVGDLSHSSLVQPRDEIGDLARTVDQILGDLRVTGLSKTYLDRILKTMADTLIVCNDQGNIQIVNQASLDILGYTEAELLGESIASVIIGVTDASLTELLDPPVRNSEVAYQTKGGDPIPMSLSTSRMPTGTDGSAPGFVLLAQDMREQKKAEGTMEKQLAAIEAAMDGIAIIGSNGRYLYVNHAFADIYGIDSHAGLVDRRWSIETGIADQENADQDILKELNVSGNWRGEVTGKRRDNTSADLEISLTLVSAGDIICTVRDITNRKLSEAELQIYRDNLERLVTDRTNNLTALNRELEAFCYSVSHDLRAPLRGIDGFSQALLEDYGEIIDDQGQDYLHRVRSASQRMGLLIDDLLKLSKVTRADVSRSEVDLSELGREISQELKQSNPDRQVSFDIEDALMITADAELLRVMLSNLLGNAWKFTAKTDEARIELGSYSDNGRTTYYVKDNGAGFDMAYVDKLFIPFQRLHTPAEFEGTGIGLATVQRIVSRHGGEIWAEAKEEEGAAFYFRFEHELAGIPA